MALTEANVEQITVRVVALGQRVEEVREAAALLQRREFWRSADGSLTVGTLGEEDKARLEGHIGKLLNETEEIVATVRGMMASGPAHAV